MSSNRLLAIFLLASCNQVFGNHAVSGDPNAIYDAPIDAPFSCPAIGMTPQFSPLLHQYQVADCLYYAQVGSEAIGYCDAMTSIAPIGTPLVPAVGLPAGGEQIARLAPDGSYVVNIEITSIPTGSRYVADGDGWTLAAPQPELAAFQLGNIVHVAGADRITAFFQFDDAIYELVFDGSAWTRVARHPFDEFAIPTGLASMFWTADALRMVISDSAANLYYTDRASLDAVFRPAELVGVSGSQYMSMPDDCSRLYLTGLGSILYAQRL